MDTTTLLVTATQVPITKLVVLCRVWLAGVFDHGGRIVSMEPGRNEDREKQPVADFRKLALACEFK